MTDLLAQPARGTLRAVALREVERNAEQQHHRNHNRAHDLAERGRHDARQQQHQDERIGDVAGDFAHRLEAPLGGERIRPGALEARRRLGRGQT